MKELLQKILAYDRTTEKFLKIKKFLNTLCIIILVCAVFFGYTSNVEIDEGTPKIYETLDLLFVIF